MRQIIGGLFLIAGCTGLGNLGRKRLREALLCLEEFVSTVSHVREYMDYSCVELHECFRTEAKTSSSKWGAVLRQVAERCEKGENLQNVWYEQVSGYLRGMPLRKEEKELMAHFPVLCYAQDRSMQSRELMRYTEKVQMLLDARRKTLASKSRITLSLGAGAGVFLFILLL